MRAVSGGEGCGVESRPGLMQEPRLPGAQAHRAVSDMVTRDDVPEGTASLADWTKASVERLYPEMGDCHPPINASGTPQ